MSNFRAPVSQYMSSPVHALGANASLEDAGRAMRAQNVSALAVTDKNSLGDAAKLMWEHRYHRIFVTEAGALAGVVSTRDLMRVSADAKIQTPIGEIATSSVMTVKDDDMVALAVDRLETNNKQGLVVVHDDWPVGSFRQIDALEARAREGTTQVQEVMDLHVLALPVFASSVSGGATGPRDGRTSDPDCRRRRERHRQRFGFRPARRLGIRSHRRVSG